MKAITKIAFILFIACASLNTYLVQAQAYDLNAPEVKNEFQWPQGKKMAISLTFDDARLTQPDKGIPLLDKYGVKATFYVSPASLLRRVDAWKKAVSNGHDIGNHSLVHPCTGNFTWSRNKALEDYTLEYMGWELDSASRLIKNVLGIDPVSFAYPCGQTFVGKGTGLKSYIPLIASKFESGRLWLSEGPNDPAFCDMAQLTGMELDGKSFEQIKKLIDGAKSKGHWLILAGHEMNEGGNQTSILSTIEALCQYAMDPVNEIWIDNVHNIAKYVREKRNEKYTGPIPVYKNPIFPVEQRIEDLLSRMTIEEKVGQMNMPCVYKQRIGWGLDDFGPVSIHRIMTQEEREKQMEGCRKFARGNHNTQIGPGGGFFTLADRIIYEGTLKQAEFFNELQKIATQESRLGIPVLQIEEGTHGFMCAGGTVFPEGLAIGASWNMDLVNRIYKAVAREARATGVHTLCTLVIEPNRDPRLGRNEEGYSEDPYLCARIAENIVTAMQGYDVSGKDKAIAALCHYPGQSEPISGLERGALEISDRELWDVYLPPWVAGIKKHGALAVMATYPAIDNVPVHSSDKILKDILRNELGFKGIVLSEGMGISTLKDEHMVATDKEAGQIAAMAGVDVGISMEDAYLGDLVESVKEGAIPVKAIDDAVRNILYVKFKLGLFEDPYVDPKKAVQIVNCEEHKQLALQTAREGIVLLKNEKNTLPLKRNIRSIAVIGPLADAEKDQLGDYIPHNIPQDIVTVLEGIRTKVASSTRVSYVKGCDVIGNKLNEINKARQAAKKADIAIVVIGEAGDITNGEGSDVANLDLTGMQEDLLKAVHSTGTPTIVVLINGRPLSVRWAAENSPAIVEAWMCGEQGGNAVAEVLFGDYNPSGRLPITVPRHSGQLPSYYNHSKTKAGKKYVDMTGEPLYEFGFGLSYTSFEYSNLQINPKEIGTGGEVEVSVDVKNTGGRKGDEVVQLYINDVLSSVTTPVKELKGFSKITLDPGQTKNIRFRLLPEDLALLDRNMKSAVEPGTFEVMVGSSSKNIRLKGNFEVK